MSTIILGPDGRPVSSDRRAAEKMYRGNPLVNWSPDVLGRQLAAWTHGDIRELAWVMEWIQQHDDICSTVSAKAIGAVARHGHGIEIVDGVKADQKQFAEAQREVLQDFYASIECGHALDVDMQGGMRLLVAQVMDGFAKGYAAHHIIWRPSLSGLRAELQQVPLWFFEARTGGLRFITSPFGYEGVPLETVGGRSAWMISRGRGVMLAATIARLYKQIPLQDWLTYCDRHGMPGFLGKTSERKGTDGWNNLVNAVRSMGAEFGAVVSAGDIIEVLDMTAQGNLPYEKLVERMDRAIAMLWRGADLSTISQGGAGSGASLQGDETQDLDADNAAWAGETIDRQLSRIVLEWHFGKGVPQLAKLVLRTKTRDDTKLEIEKIKAAIEFGLNPDRNWAATRLGVVEADKGELGLGKSEAAMPGVAAANANPYREPAGNRSGGRFARKPSGDDDEDQVVTALELPNTLTGTNVSEWRREVRAYIDAHLVGTQVTNKDSGHIIHFTGQSKREAVSKIRKEEAFKAAKSISRIAEESVHLGYVDESKNRNAFGYDYYAMPVMVNGKSYDAWFNVQNKPTGERVFYEFGLYKQKAVDSQSITGISTSPSPSTAARTIAQYLADVKTYLPAAQKFIHPDGSVPASNSAPIYPEAIEEAIMRVTKIRAVQLNDLADIIDEMIEAEELSDDELEAYSQRIMKVIPQNLSPEATEAMADDLARKMGEAITKQISQSL